MRKFGLIGYPLGHSFSQKYFGEKFRKENIEDCVYDNYPLQDLSIFPELISTEPDICGLNVTIPYKSEIIPFLDWISPEADEIGAVNVVKIKKIQGRVLLNGYNSDITGIQDSISSFGTINIKNAVVFGTGGSSRAVCYVLKKMGYVVTLVSRNKKADSITYSEITSELINNTGLIVNTTPLGMYPDIESKPDFNYKLLNSNHYLFDLVYNPELTSFLKMGLLQECNVLSGLKMLHSQAEKAWDIWNDINL